MNAVASPSRTKHFVAALLTGYGTIGVNILCTLLTVPVALHYLTRAEFGLWALVGQLTGYINLIDLGMSGSISRTLVDHKDQRHDGGYGSVVQTSFLVGIAQGLIVIAASFLLAFCTTDLLNVESALRGTFLRLVIAQGIFIGLGFIFRPPSLMCAAHQRYDVVNYAQSINQVVNVGVLWISFFLGAGIFSLVWAFAASQVASIAVVFWGCVHLKFLPAKGEWGKPTWQLFHELFAFGRDVFLWGLGAQLINASQILLITRVLGLEAGAVWSVGVRLYNMLGQFIFRIFDFASGAFAEMMVRHERERLLRRFQSVVVLSSSLAALGGVMYASLNQPFIELWTSGRISWAVRNDILLGVLLVMQVVMKAHAGLVGQTKKFGAFRYLYFIEGLFFIFGSLLVLPRWGITGMLGVAIAGTALFSLRYGLLRTCRYFALPAREVVFEWAKPMGRLLLALVPLAVAFHFLFGMLPTSLKLPALVLAVGIPGLGLFFRLGLDSELKCELLRRIPKKIAPVLTLLFG